MTPKLKNLLVVFVYVIFGAGLVFYISDRPLSLSKSENENAAIAIRDNVSDLEKNGSLLFTEAYLNTKYKHSIYFTQQSREDQRQEFIDSLTYLLTHYKSVDVYLLAHHNYYHHWLCDIDPALLLHLNLIYNTGCGNAADSTNYKMLGAKYYIAHKGKKSLSPIFYFYFLRRLNTSTDPESATIKANERVGRVLSFLGIENEIKEHEGRIY